VILAKEFGFSEV